MGNSPRDCGPGGQMIGNGWALFLSGGELSSWGVVLEPLKLYEITAQCSIAIYSQACL